MHVKKYIAFTEKSEFQANLSIPPWMMTTPDTSERLETQHSWPQHGRFLVPGVNDTWNDFQKFGTRNRKIATSKDWRVARAALHVEYQQFIDEGGMPLSIDQPASRLLDGIDYYRDIFGLTLWIGFQVPGKE